MSRTLGQILTIGAAIAVNVIPGAGQAISATIFGGFLSAAAVTAAAGYITAGLTVAGLSSAASLLGLGPKVPPPAQTQTSIKSPRPARIFANGSRRLWGASILFETSVSGNAVDVWAFSDSRLNAVNQIYLNDDKVTISGGIVQALPDKRYQRSRVRVGWNVGLPTETAFSYVTADIPAWDASHRGDGVVTGYLIKYKEKEKEYITTFPQGDNIQMSIAGNWGLHFDPRNPAQDPYDKNTWVYSENAAVHFLTYLIEHRALDWDSQGEPQRAKIEEAIQDCDNAQPLAAGGVEPRYRGCVVYKATDEPAAIISEMLAAFDGWYCFNENDELILYSGRYYTPTVSLGPDQIVSYRDAGGAAAEDEINEIRVSYISSLHDYAQVEAQSWRDEASITASGREPNSTQLDAQTPSYTQNRRLAKRMMARLNAGDKLNIVTTYGGGIALGERFINLTVREGDFVAYDGPVEVITSPEIDLQTGGVTFDCVSVDPNIDAWNPATEDGEGAPVGNRIPRDPLYMPVISSADALYSEDGLSVQINLIVADVSIDDLTWYARWRVVGDINWNEQPYTDLDPDEAINLLTSLVPVNAMIEVAVAYGHPDGRISEWSLSEIVDTESEAAVDYDGGDAGTEILD